MFFAVVFVRLPSKGVVSLRLTLWRCLGHLGSHFKFRSGDRSKCFRPINLNKMCQSCHNCHKAGRFVTLPLYVSLSGSSPSRMEIATITLPSPMERRFPFVTSKFYRLPWRHLQFTPWRVWTHPSMMVPLYIAPLWTDMYIRSLRCNCVNCYFTISSTSHPTVGIRWNNLRSCVEFCIAYTPFHTLQYVCYAVLFRTTGIRCLSDFIAEQRRDTKK